MKKRIMRAVLFIQIVIVSVNIMNLTLVSAQDAPVFRVTPPQYIAPVFRINETFTIEVTITNLGATAKLIGLHFRLAYDPQLLTVLDIAEGPFLAQFNQTSDPPHTLFGSCVEVDGMFGPHILAFNMLFPNATGEWPGPFPEGNGTIATITFNATGQTTVEPELPANCTLEIIEVMVLTDLGEELPFNITSGYYEIPPLLYPVAQFCYQPVFPSVGEVVIFNATESYDPDYEINVYSWDFGDGTITNTTEPVIGHTYSQQGTFNVILTVTDIDGLSLNITDTITIGYYEELTVSIDVGSIHFAGELADFYVLVSDFGRRIDATNFKAMLFYDGSLFANLTTITQRVSTGLYRIAYEIPADAEPGTYTLVVETECYSVKGTNLKSFLVSSTLSGFVTDITQGIATVSKDLTEVKMNLTAINAKLVDIEGNIGIINSTVGTLKTEIKKLNATIAGLIVNSKGEILANVATSLNTLTVKLDSIDGKIGDVNGDTATIFTTLGEIKITLGDTQSIATTTLYVTSALSAIAVILAAVILIFLRKK